MDYWTLILKEGKIIAKYIAHMRDLRTVPKKIPSYLKYFVKSIYNKISGVL